MVKREGAPRAEKETEENEQNDLAGSYDFDCICGGL